jgi:hypothetical protein
VGCNGNQLFDLVLHNMLERTAAAACEMQTRRDLYVGTHRHSIPTPYQSWWRAPHPCNVATVLVLTLCPMPFAIYFTVNLVSMQGLVMPLASFAVFRPCH